MRKLKGLAFPLILIFMWWAGSELGCFNSYIVPNPLKVIETFYSLIARGVLLKHVGMSLFRVFAGFALTFTIAFPLAVFVGMSESVHGFLSPTLEFIRHIPPIAMIPLLILWFGLGEIPKIAVIILATFFPIFINTLNGIAGCDENLAEVGKVYGFNRWESFVRIILPQAMPSILAGMQLGLGYSWRSLIGAELIAASSGIGYMIIEAEQLSRIDIIFVGIFVIGGLGCFIDYIFFRVSDRLVRRKGGDHGRNKDKETDEILCS